MAAAQISAAEVPVACSLSTAGLAEQARRWARLAARAMTGYARTEDGLRLEFRPEPGVEEELRSLVAVEAQCCPWAAWTVLASGTQVVLDVRAAGDGIAALHGMLTGLRRASAHGRPAATGRLPPGAKPV